MSTNRPNVREFFILLVTVCICGSVVGLSAQAQMDDASRTASQQTQQLLKSKEDRQKYIADHADAKAANARVQGISNSPEDTQAIYDISSGIFSDVAQRNQDPKKQQEMMNQAAKDPEAFMRSLSSEQQAQIHTLAEKIEKQNKAVKAQP